MNQEVLDFFAQFDRYVVSILVLSLLALLCVIVFGFVFADGHDKHDKRIEVLEHDLLKEHEKVEYLGKLICRMDYGVYLQCQKKGVKRRKKL